MMKISIAAVDWREEFANSVSHGIGFLVLLIAAPWLLTGSRRQTAELTGMLVFVCAAALVYLSSTLYHALPPGRAKRLVLKIDCSAIFIFIAGSYTAFALLDSARALNWLVLTLIWGLALLGLLLNLFELLAQPRRAIAYYLVFGWLTLLAALPLLLRMPHASACWLVAGGVIYSAGTIFYSLGARLRFSHLGWHLFVMLGSGCHFVALLR